MRQRRVERAQRMFDGVLARAAGQRFDKTGQRVRQRDIGARLPVAAVMYGGRERAANQLDGLRENISLMGVAQVAKYPSAAWKNASKP